MELDDAIKHCENVAEATCGGCADEHGQLAEWLKELKQWRDDDKKEAEAIQLYTHICFGLRDMHDPRCLIENDGTCPYAPFGYCKTVKNMAEKWLGNSKTACEEREER